VLFKTSLFNHLLVIKIKSFINHKITFSFMTNTFKSLKTPNKSMGERITADDALRAFQDTEINYFLDTRFPYDETRLFLDITREQHPDIQARTKRGVESGIEEYVQSQGVPTIYQADVGRFGFDGAVPRHITKQLAPLALEGTPEYAEEVRQAYATFTYNESLKRFNSLFR
jgi:hypothetical protein